MTEAGERLFAGSAPAFRDIDDALEDLNNFRGKPAGTLRFTAARQSTQLVLLPIVTRFLKCFPDVSVEIVINDALIDMVAAGFDAGVRFGETIAADMIAVPIGPRHRFAVVGSPGYFKSRKPPTTPHDLKGIRASATASPQARSIIGSSSAAASRSMIDVEGPLTLNDQDLMVDARWTAPVSLRVRGAGRGADRKAAGARAGRLVSGLSRFFLNYPSRRQLPAALRAFVDFARQAAVARMERASDRST